MNGSQNPKRDSAEEALLLLERENEEFKRHWVWKELNCTPDDFFKAVQKHVASLPVSPEKWKQTYEKAKQISRVRSLEKRGAYRPASLKMLGSIRV